MVMPIRMRVLLCLHLGYHVLHLLPSLGNYLLRGVVGSVSDAYHGLHHWAQEVPNAGQ
jgi:hypothetical protein